MMPFDHAHPFHPEHQPTPHPEVNWSQPGYVPEPSVNQFDPRVSGAMHHPAHQQYAQAPKPRQMKTQNALYPYEIPQPPRQTVVLWSSGPIPPFVMLPMSAPPIQSYELN